MKDAGKPSSGSSFSFANQGVIAMASATAVKDPGCGMDMDTATAAGHTEHAGLVREHLQPCPDLWRRSQ